MKIEVAKSDLENALKVVNIGSSGSGGDLTTHILFRHADSQTELLAYNGRLGTSSPLVCQTTLEDEGVSAFTVESDRLTRWLTAAGDVAVTLEAKDAIVTATGSLGSVKFRSLDPSGFPFWDKQISGAKRTIEIEANRLHQALGHSKSFISSADTTRPELAVTEIRGGTLWATDQAALSMVTLEEFSDAALRLSGKDIGPILTFLSLSGEDKVEVLEHKRSMFIRREDGSVLNAGRPSTPFLELEDIDNDENAHWWVIGCSDLDRAIKQLSASAAKEELGLTFNFDPSDQKITLSMTGDSGSTNTLKLPCPEFGSKADVEVGMPQSGWKVEYTYISRLLASYRGGKTIKIGLNPAGEDGGWAKIEEDRDGDKYLTILVWMPE